MISGSPLVKIGGTHSWNIGQISEIWASFPGEHAAVLVLFILNETFVGVCYLLDLGTSRYQEIRVPKSVGCFRFVDRIFLHTLISMR